MSRTAPTALVLGAGSSCAFGYPVGAGLRQKLLDLTSAHRLEFAIRAGLMQTSGVLHDFVDTFRRSQMESIDSFLARRPNYSDIGKRAIAAALLEHENEAHLFQAEPEDHWYRYLFNRIAAERWDDLRLDHFAVVTFNYDRSLETYLLGSLQASYGVSSEEAVQKLRAMPIVHVYGRLGSPFPGDDDYLPYGASIDAERVDRAARGIQVIPEGREDAETLTTARGLLAGARKIVFLGFGFDPTNLARLHATETCKQILRTADSVGYRKVVATCHRLTRAEARKAFEGIGQVIRPENAHLDVPPDFYPESCIMALRSSLVLD